MISPASTATPFRTFTGADEPFEGDSRGTAGRRWKRRVQARVRRERVKRVTIAETLRAT